MENDQLLNNSNVNINESPEQDCKNQQGSTWYASVFLIVNAGLGAGLLNFPAAFDQSGGLFIAITVQAILMVFIIGSLLILIYCSSVNNWLAPIPHLRATYQEAVASICGEKALTICSFIIVIYCFGTCITFFIIIGDQWDICWYLLKWPISSILGVIAVIYCVGLIIVKFFVIDTSHVVIKTRPDHWSEAFLVIPAICFGYQCHLSVVPIYACLKKRTFSEFLKTVSCAILILIITYTVCASFGYLTFGRKVNADVLLSYPPTPDVLIAVVFVALKMYTTYPILLFVGRAAFESIFVKYRLRNRLNEQTETQCIIYEKEDNFRRYMTTTIWFAGTLSLALVIPDIGVVISLLGGLAALFIFTFPGLCLLQLVLKHRALSNLKYYLLFSMAIGYLVLGAFIFGLTTSQSLLRDFSQPPLKIHIHGCQ